MPSHPTSRRGNCPQFDRSIRFHRRHLLHAGALGSLGFALPQLLQGRALASDSPAARPKAKACILIFMWGGPSHLDTFDMKPEAPAEIRGTFQATATNVPGMQWCEHFTKLSQMADKVAVIRSLGHDDPAHLSSGHATVTGNLAPVIKSDATPPSDKDSPHLGAVLSKLRPTTSGVPSFVTLPWKVFHPAAPGGEAPGQHGGWLGSAYDGLLLTGDPNDPAWSPPGLTLPQDITVERLESRYHLLKTLDQQRQRGAMASSTGKLRDYQSRAYELLGAPEVRRAFDIKQEPEVVRERYGKNIHGQCVLMARRLVEHGVPLVTVNWHNDGRNFWDTHGDNFNRLKNDLIPPADQALSALIEDLGQRGMLDETLIAWVGEFGRRPQITPENAGREHWPYCYSGLFAGGGIQGGAVYGQSDRSGAYPIENHVTPQDYASTILHALGVPADTVLHDREGRPHTISQGKAITALFG